MAGSLDPHLSDRLTAAHEAVLDCFDQVLADPSPAHLDALRRALDDLMRAAARIRLELEQN